MLGFLFRTLTADSNRGVASFDAITRLTREPHWYVEGKLPDTIDGRFAVLATITALVIVRLEKDSEEGNPAAVALTERFIEVMESEHRELGLGDPALGRTVRRLVGSLARRTELWRLATEGEKDWQEAARESLYKSGVTLSGLRHSSEATKRLWDRLERCGLSNLKEGRVE